MSACAPSLFTDSAGTLAQLMVSYGRASTVVPRRRISFSDYYSVSRREVELEELRRSIRDQVDLPSFVTKLLLL